MIVFKSLSWCNLLSSGHQKTVVALNKSTTTLVLGHNGSGKSTMLDALCLALYKKPFRKINKAQIVNAINGGGCEIECEFSIGTREYSVRRGIKPDFFELSIDGKPREHLEAAKKEDEKFVAEDILKIDCDTFKQVVILGNADYTPFMQLKTPQRREFIEQILDIGVFSLMNDLLKVRQSGVKTRLDQISRDTLSLKEQTGLVRGFITKLEDEAKKASQDIQEQIDQGNDSIAGLMSQMAALTSIELALTDTITDADAITKGIKSKLDFQRQGLQKIREAEQVIAFYVGHDTCSTCSQEIGEAHRNAIVSKNQSIIDRVLVVLVELDTDLVAKRSRQKEIDGVLKKIQKVNAEVQEATGSVRVARRYVGKLNEDLKKQPGNVQEQYDRLAALNAKHVELEIEREETLELKRCHEVASVLLKDGGIKSAIIKQYLPMINRLVNKYLAELDFFLSFTLDEGFSETFKSRNRDAMSYFSFSEGEKLRIDLALLFTWREVARMKNSCATNLLILDEVIDSSLDNNGTDFFIRMLHDLGGASNVFVISHKSDAALDKFEDVIRFHKHGNFSRRDDVEVIPSVAT